jgi:dsRNA-specific ribonuclease
MMNRTEIQKFFLLENDPQLFDIAIRPRSCGGGAKFEHLALYGDQVINIHLYNYLISKGWERKITKCKTTIHKKLVIKAFADYLGIPDLLISLNSTYHPEDKDLAETVEALIGAAFETNGLKRCFPIIHSFLIFTYKKQKELRKQGEFDESQNYKGRLFELFKDPLLNTSDAHLSASDLEPTRIGGTDDTPIFQFKGDITFNGLRHEISTNPWPTKISAEQEAAYLILRSITGNNAEYSNYDPTRDNMLASQEKTVYPTTSIDNEELIFRKPVYNNESMEVDQNTGELLVDWVNRKAQKNVFGMLILLSARLDTVSGASWTCEFSSGVLALINLQLGEEKYFAIGFGPSKSKARKAAGEDILMKVNLIEWLEKHYTNHTI